MTNEKILENLLTIKKEECGGYSPKMESLILTMKEMIRIEISKKGGSKPKDLTIIKKIVKEEKRNKIFGGYHEFDFDGVDYKGFCDGYRILASNDIFGYEHVENQLDMKKMFVGFSELEKIVVDKQEVEYFMKTTDKKSKNPYIVENDIIKIGFNPSYLLDAINFCDTVEIYVHKGNGKAPCQIISEDKSKIAIVLPVSMSK